MIERMYLASRSPRSSLTCSWSSSNSRPSASSCSALSLWSGFSGSSASLGMGLLRVRSRSAPRGRGCRCGWSRPGCRAPCRCAGRGPGPSRSVPTQVWQMPSRQPKGSSRPASSPATRIGVEPSHSVSQSETLKAIVPPSPSSPPPILGWKRSMCRRSQSPCALPVLVERVEHLAGAGDEGVALLQSGHRRSRSAGSRRPCSFVCCSCSVKPSCFVGELAQLVAEDDLLARAGGVQEDDVVERVAVLEAADHAHDRRDAAAGAR